MSYCRFGSGDIYLFEDAAGGIDCCMCSILPARFLVRPKMEAPWKRLAKKRHPFPKKDAKKRFHLEGKFLPRQAFLATPQDALSHVQLHLLRGHHVPMYAIERLQEEIQSGYMPARKKRWNGLAKIR